MLTTISEIGDFKGEPSLSKIQLAFLGLMLRPPIYRGQTCELLYQTILGFVRRILSLSVSVHSLVCLTEFGPFAIGHLFVQPVGEGPYRNLVLTRHRQFKSVKFGCSVFTPERFFWTAQIQYGARRRNTAETWLRSYDVSVDVDEMGATEFWKPKSSRMCICYLIECYLSMYLYEGHCDGDGLVDNSLVKNPKHAFGCRLMTN